MPNPLRSIIPILDTLGKELKILPATGGAVEDPQHHLVLRISLK